jgi:hypothetical protein
MALKMQKTLSSGVIANYWKIDKIDIHFGTTTSYVYMNIFLDKTSRDSDKEKIESFTFELSGADFPYLSEIPDVRAVAYNVLKTKPEFEGSEDI